MNAVFGMLLIGHLVGDFYLQDDRTAVRKARCRRLCLTHCGMYALCEGVVCLMLWLAGFLPAVPAIIAWLLVAATHLFVDCSLRPVIAAHAKSGTFSLCTDQALHVVCCCLVAYFAADAVDSGACSAEIRFLTLWMGALLFCGKPALVIVRTLLDDRRSQAERDDEPGALSVKNAGMPNSGSTIGVLERVLVCALTLLNQFDAIAFVIAAKSIARYERMKDDANFAEVYLIGTLASVALAMFSSLLFKWLLM